MAIVSLTSENPSFSFIIKKNPNAGMTLRSIRKGIAFGWYTNEHTYNILFKDAENEISYKENNNEYFEYLNLSRYNSPTFPLNAISEFVPHVLKNKNELDESGYHHTLYVNMVYLKNERYIEIFQRYFRDYTIEVKEVSKHNYRITIKTETSLQKLLQFSTLLFVFLAMMGKEYMDVPDELANKYVEIMNELDCPYFIRYLFVKNIIREKRQFKILRNKLEKSSLYKIHFEYGNTADQRRNVIDTILPFNKDILDIGCGEGAYAIPLSSKINDYTYHAIDVDEEMLQTVKKKILRKNLSNIALYSSLQSFIDQYNQQSVDVILTEVIEHMTIEEAEKLIELVVQNITFDRFIITTPNRDFNLFYELETMRHDDHKWEMNQQEFEDWMIKILSMHKLNLKFIPIGDSVNNIYTTQGVVITKAGEDK